MAVTAWDATDVDTHADAVKAAWDAAAGDVDCVVLAAGVLGDQDHLADDPERGRATSSPPTSPARCPPCCTWPSG